MTIFQSYAEYYDLFYRDKPYEGEADYFLGLLDRHGPRVRTVLDLGCGTGSHALCLAARGIRVIGVDRSVTAVGRAREKATAVDRGPAPAFVAGDVRNVRLKRSFDAVVSLFHVVSYQTTDADIRAMLQTARAHLPTGHLFVFDCWYGPGVLSDPPAVRVRRFSDDRVSVLRVSEPFPGPDRNTVDVGYHLAVREKDADRRRDIEETHRLRYLFSPEIECFLADSGFSPVAAHAWLTDAPPAVDTWYAAFVARAV